MTALSTLKGVNQSSHETSNWTLNDIDLRCLIVCVMGVVYSLYLYKYDIFDMRILNTEDFLKSPVMNGIVQLDLIDNCSTRSKTLVSQPQQKRLTVQ